MSKQSKVRVNAGGPPPVALNVQNSSKTRNRKRNKKQGTVAIRNMVTASIPRPSFTIRSSRMYNGDVILSVSGTEVVQEVLSFSSTIAAGAPSELVMDRLLNVADPQMFPRLAGVATTFDKFKFKRVCLHYHSGCPSTASGAVGIGFITDPNDPVPVDCVALADYAHAAVSTVTMPVSCEIVPADDVWQFTSSAPASIQLASSPATTVAQVNPFYGSLRAVCKVDHAGGTNTGGTFLGYLAIEYDVELWRLRPVVQSVASGNYNSLTASTALSNTLQFAPLNTNYTNVRGWFDTFSQAVALATDTYNLLTTSGTYASSRLGKMNKSNTLMITEGEWLDSGILTVSSGTTFDSRSPIRREGRKVLPPGKIFIHERYVPKRSQSNHEVPFMVFSDDEKSHHPTLDDYLTTDGVDIGLTTESMNVVAYGAPLDGSATATVISSFGMTIPTATNTSIPWSLLFQLPGPTVVTFLLDCSSLTGTVQINPNYTTQSLCRVSADNSSSASVQS
jgi:hypothetical protein